MHFAFAEALMRQRNVSTTNVSQKRHAQLICSITWQKDMVERMQWSNMQLCMTKSRYLAMISWGHPVAFRFPMSLECCRHALVTSPSAASATWQDTRSNGVRDCIVRPFIKVSLRFLSADLSTAWVQVLGDRPKRNCFTRLHFWNFKYFNFLFVELLFIKYE